MNTEIDNIKKKQRKILELKNTMTAIKNAEELATNLFKVEGRIHELEGVAKLFSQRRKKKIE